MNGHRNYFMIKSLRKNGTKLGMNSMLYSVYHIFHFTISMCLALKNASKTEEWRNFCVMSRHLFTSDVIKLSTLRAGHDNLSPFKIHDFPLSSWQADNQLAGNSVSHMQTLGYHSKMSLKYVISVNMGYPYGECSWVPLRSHMG